ncbi:hypothetical protein H0H93_010777 [Arthromyces matolae]|nr:hypothetical protein H0H93_010777 [Arthromyces matolae]
MSATMTSAILMSSSLPVDFGRTVRFDDECVLIPEPSNKRSKPTKMYTLPLWKKRTNDEVEPTVSSLLSSSSSRSQQSPEETHVVVKVPIPRFISRSPSRGRGISSSPTTPKPLSPCLVNRDPSSSPPGPTMPKALRRTSLPLPLITCNVPKHDIAAATVPLRPCCAACVTVTEESCKEGEDWQEKFSRGARRRRSSSLDNSISTGSIISGSNGIGFGHEATHSGAVASHLVSHVDLSPGTRYRASAFALRVDEVDRRRKSQEFLAEDILMLRSSSSSSPRSSSGVNPYISTSRSDASVVIPSSLDVPPRPTKSSPIQEEDEDQLFPLPSPRRTPTGSPASSVVPSPNPSPNASTSCLAPPASTSGVGSGLRLGSDEILVKSLSRKSDTPASPTTVQDIASPSNPSTQTQKPHLSIEVASPDLLGQGHSRSRSVPIPIPVPTNKTKSLPSPPAPASPKSPKTRRPSFSLSIKDAIKGAGADMLKGVTSMGGGGVMGSI